MKKLFFCFYEGYEERTRKLNYATKNKFNISVDEISNIKISFYGFLRWVLDQRWKLVKNYNS